MNAVIVEVIVRKYGKFTEFFSYITIDQIQKKLLDYLTKHTLSAIGLLGRVED